MHHVHVSLDVSWLMPETKSIKNNLGIIGNDMIRIMSS